MEWSDKGIVLSSRKHGESASIVSLFTQYHGRHSGLVRGGFSSRFRGIYQIGNLVSADWRARLSEHLGIYSCELVQPNAAILMNDRLPLQALVAATSMLEIFLPEREPYTKTFEKLCDLISSLSARDDWVTCYVHWEISLLADLGYGLDLTKCIVTGRTDNLVFVSPRSGCAVSMEAGQQYSDKLFSLPAFLLGKHMDTKSADISDALRITGHFLSLFARDADFDKLPSARGEFITQLLRS